MDKYLLFKIMNKAEKIILKEAVGRGRLLSPADLINGIAERDEKSVQSLVVKKYIEEVPQAQHGTGGRTYEINFYRPTEKGIVAVSPFYLRLWNETKKDLRSIMVAAITAFVVSLVV